MWSRPSQFWTGSAHNMWILQTFLLESTPSSQVAESCWSNFTSYSENKTRGYQQIEALRLWTCSIRWTRIRDGLVEPSLGVWRILAKSWMVSRTVQLVRDGLSSAAQSTCFVLKLCWRCFFNVLFLASYPTILQLPWISDIEIYWEILRDILRDEC